MGESWWVAGHWFWIVRVTSLQSWREFLETLYLTLLILKWSTTLWLRKLASLRWHGRRSLLDGVLHHTWLCILIFMLQSWYPYLCVRACLCPCMHIHTYFIEVGLSLVNISWAIPLSLLCFYYWIKTRYLPSTNSKNITSIIYLYSCVQILSI